MEHLDFTRIPAAYRVLRKSVQRFIVDTLGDYPADRAVLSWQGFDAAFSRKLAARGWVGLTLPKRYGGAELDALARFVVVEELLCAGAPVAAHWIADRQSGPLILRFGTEQQRSFYLPRICAARAFFCIGMSEPDSGSDLASIASHAERVPDGWRLNGHKIWSTYADRSDYMIALVRTSGATADRHAGLSQFVIDLRATGVLVRPIRDLAGDCHFSEVFFDDVHLGADQLVGEEGAGWSQVTAELAFERSGPERIYSSMALLGAWLKWLRAHGGDSHAGLVGRLLAELAVLRALSIAVAARLAAGAQPVIEAALVKDAGTSFEQSVPSLLADAIASCGLPPPPVVARALAYLLWMSPSFSLRGGTREILRGVIARGLGLR